MKFLFSSFLFLMILLMACTPQQNDVEMVSEINKKISKKMTPDKRVAIYQLSFQDQGNKVVIKGETNQPKALKMLTDSLKKHHVNFINLVRILPDSAVASKKYAVAKNSVINIRSKPKHSAELGTQGLLGMNLKVYDKKGDFYRVQTPDNYISWVDKGGITLMNHKEFSDWNAKTKVIYTKIAGFVYQKKDIHSTVVSDIVFGCTLALLNEDPHFYKVVYPDNRVGFIKKDEASLYDSWLLNNTASSENIEKYAKQFLGFPYLWGGTSTKGADCSGFTKTVYLMNGFIIPRDASQQILAGKIVDKNLVFKDLQKGDLMFFGRKATKNKKQRVTHVGIWLGNGKGEFIHSSGNVHLSSINKNEKNYDEFNKSRYLGSRRYLGIPDVNITNLKEKKSVKN